MNNNFMETSYNILRDRSTTTTEFRRAAKVICAEMATQASTLLKKKNIDPETIIPVIILRASLAFLDAIVEHFPGRPIGVLGLKRDEHTLRPRWYYENLPAITKESHVIIFDPMLATGGSTQATIEKLMTLGANPQNIYFIGIIAAPEGCACITRFIPEENMIIAAVDKGLDDHGMIVPGLGDFGDRYFGYEGQATLCS